MITRRKFLKVLGFGAAAGAAAAVLPAAPVTPTIGVDMGKAGRFSMADIVDVSITSSKINPDFDFPPSMVRHMKERQAMLNKIRTAQMHAVALEPKPPVINKLKRA